MTIGLLHDAVAGPVKLHVGQAFVLLGSIWLGWSLVKLRTQYVAAKARKSRRR